MKSSGRCPPLDALRVNAHFLGRSRSGCDRPVVPGIDGRREAGWPRAAELLLRWMNSRSGRPGRAEQDEHRRRLPRSRRENQRCTSSSSPRPRAHATPRRTGSAARARLAPLAAPARWHRRGWHRRGCTGGRLSHENGPDLTSLAAPRSTGPRRKTAEARQRAGAAGRPARAADPPPCQIRRATVSSSPGADERGHLGLRLSPLGARRPAEPPAPSEWVSR